MSDVLVRPLMLSDIAELMALDHSYHTDYVWQMELDAQPAEVKVRFREIRLPRSMRVDYPRSVEQLGDDWQHREGLLIAEKGEQVVGYISLRRASGTDLVSVTDLVTRRRLRRQGIGTALLRAGQTWAAERQVHRLQLEMQSKNYPAICLSNKLGFEFCGYSDRFYANQDIALFFAKRI